MIDRVLQTKPVEMDHQHGEKFLRDVCEGGSWINDSDIEFFASKHEMVVHWDPFQIKFVCMCFPHRYPSDFFRNLTLTIVASYLKVASIFS